ncbi:MAG: sugar ABC transporter permease [Caldilineaceae bacterium SB0665_bin_21]|nr:sugar ABC transporter permease [Caldilineaceae bacterium SB0665_bin_21]MYC62152.1 sugar ABC transporter permease [Caldilineaceae bacterium SB0661_bin_34]
MTTRQLPADTSLRTRLGRMTWKGERIEWSAYFYVLPFFVPFVIFTILAIIFGAYVSFTEWRIIGDPLWVGFANYVRAFNDDFVPKVWGNTFQLAAIVVPGTTILALLFALYVNQRLRGFTASRLAFYAPRVVSVTVVGLVWVWMLDTRFGVINQYLHKVGVPYIPWLTNPDWVLWAVGMTTIWWDLGFHMVILLAALQDIPSELKDSASIDGASALQQFWYVVVPLLRPAISLVITLEIISAFRIFSQIFVMTQGGPAGASFSIIFYIYERGFMNTELGYSSALSLMLFFTILVVTLIQLRIIRERA